MFERIKILTILQLSNKSRTYVKGSKRIYSFIAIRLAIIIAITVVAYLVLHALKNLLYIPVNHFLLITILMITQGLSIIVAMIGLSNDLYHSKDNQILFSLPVKNDEIFISKIIVYYINEFVRNLYLLVPIFIGFGLITSASFLYFFSLVFVIFLLPLISMGIASFITIPITVVTNFFKRHNVLTGIVIIIGVSGLFYLTTLLISQIPTPIRIVQLYNRFIISLSFALQKMASVGSIYTVIGKMMFGYNYLINLLILLTTVIAIVLLNYYVSKPLYFKLMSKSSENTIKQKEITRSFETKSLFHTFLKKEFIIQRRSLNELLTNYSLLLTLPFFIYILNYIYMGMNRSSFGNQIVLILNVIITLLIVTSSNTASANAITTEGYEFVLLKTAPYNTSKMAWAKITFNLVFTTLVIFISYILFSIALPVFPKQDVWLLFLVVILVNAGHIFWSFQIDILSPKLSDYAQTASISNNVNVSKSLTIGLMIAIFFGILGVFSFVFLKSFAWILMIGIAVSFMVWRMYAFHTYLNAFFDDIEY